MAAALSFHQHKQRRLYERNTEKRRHGIGYQ